MMEFIEAVVPGDRQKAAKGLYQTLQRDLVRRILDRTNEYAPWFGQAFVVIPRDRIVTSDIAEVVAAMESTGPACIGMVGGNKSEAKHHFEREYYDPAKHQEVVICSCGTAISADVGSDGQSAARERAFERLNEHMEGQDKSGLLRVGQAWQHTTGKRMNVVAVNVTTRMWGLTNITEDPDTGELMATSSREEDLINWTLME